MTSSRDRAVCVFVEFAVVYCCHLSDFYNPATVASDGSVIFRQCWGVILQTRLKKLTEKEAEILRLLARGFDIKASANELGISPNSVTERLRSARQKLGVSSSREAARLYVRHAEPDHIFYVPTGNVVERPSPPDPASDLPEYRAGGEDIQTTALLEQNAASFAHKPVSIGGLAYLPLRGAGETRNELSRRQRLTAIFDLTTKLAGGVALTCLLALIVDRLVASL